MDEIQETESDEIQDSTAIPRAQSSVTDIKVPEIKSEPIQLTPSLSPVDPEPEEANDSRTSSIDNIEKFEKIEKPRKMEEMEQCIKN